MRLRTVDLGWYRDGVDWTPLLSEERAAARRLLSAFKQEAVRTIGSTAFNTALAGVEAANRLWGGPFGEEIDRIAGAAGSEYGLVLGANLSYDAGHAGCTTAAVETKRGPLHFRNMDWDFPRKLLQKRSTIVRVRGAPAGDYLTLTWPGFFGGLTAVAPGRFAITVNFVNHPDESKATGLLWRGLKGFWPVPWAVRNALDTARTFKAAVRQLSEAYLLSPVLLMVTGPNPGEAVVIERGVDSYEHRRTKDGDPLLLTNHYLAPRSRHENVEDIEEVMYSATRLRRLGEELSARSPATAEEAFEVLDADEILMAETQQQVVLSAAEGTMTLRVPGYEELVASL